MGQVRLRLLLKDKVLHVEGVCLAKADALLLNQADAMLLIQLVRLVYAEALRQASLRIVINQKDFLPFFGKGNPQIQAGCGLPAVFLIRYSDCLAHSLVPPSFVFINSDGNRQGIRNIKRTLPK